MYRSNALLAGVGLLLLLGLPAAKFTANLTVQVFDQDLRPVEGAQVYVEYQLNAVDGDIKTKPKLTNESGLVFIQFTNYEEIENSTDYTYVLYTKYGDQLKTADLAANATYIRKYSMHVEAYYLFVGAFDQNGKPIVANVTVGEETKETDTTGRVGFQVPQGSYTIKVEQKDFVRNQDINISQDESVDITVGLYELEVRVTDDNKNPLLASVEVSSQHKETDSTGTAVFGNISNEAPQVVARYGQGFKKATPSLKTQTSVDIVFDLNKPVIKELYVDLSDSGAGTLGLFADDLGIAASGIETVAVSYEVDGIETSVPAYSIAYNTFEAKLPAQAPGTLVKYSATVTDKEGNSAYGAGSYAIPGDEPPEPEPEPDGEGFDLGIPVETIVIAIVVFAIVAYGVLFYLNKRKRDSLPPVPPAQPPSQPPTIPQA